MNNNIRSSCQRLSSMSPSSRFRLRQTDVMAWITWQLPCLLLRPKGPDRKAVLLASFVGLPLHYPTYCTILVGATCSEGRAGYPITEGLVFKIPLPRSPLLCAKLQRLPIGLVVPCSAAATHWCKSVYVYGWMTVAIRSLILQSNQINNQH